MLIFLIASGCRFWQTSENPAPAANSVGADESKSELPFSVKEPEIFEAEITTTTGGAERRNFIAKNGLQKLYAFNYQTKNQLTILQTDKTYLVFPAKKIFAQETEPTAFAASDDWQNFLNNEWLNQKSAAKFDKIETDGNIVKYRVELGEQSASEIFLYLDESLGMPIKQEFYSVEGENKNLIYTFEIKNLKLQSDANLFIVPTDYKKVSAEELRANLAN